MDDNTTIIISTRNNYEVIFKTITKLTYYIKKYFNIREILFCDNYSTDGTIMKILSNTETNDNMRLITTNKKQSFKKILLKGISEAKTTNIILLEPELYTRLHQIQRQIHSLRKTHLLMPSRLNKKSKTTYKNKQEEVRIRSRNLFLQMITGLRYTDLTNTNKAFKKDKVLPLLNRTKSEKNFWIETIILCKNKGLKVNETSTHYVQQEKIRADPIISFLHNIRELKKIKKLKKN